MRTFRTYSLDDKNACLAIFDSNVPEYFSVRDRSEYGSFLERPPGPYFVVEDTGAVVACGGFAPHQTEPESVILCWGMVARDHHKTGLGRLLMSERLNRQTTAKNIVLNTSQFTSGFYEQLGFKTFQIIRDGHGPGVDLYEMRVLR